MKKHSLPFVAPGLLVLAFLVVAGACESMPVRNYPPDFQQLSRTEVRGAMRQMAQHVTALDDTLRDEALPAEARQERVLASLDGIRETASSLGGRGLSSSHYMLDRLLPQFIEDVERARAAAATTPPRYYLAGSVAGSCMACHRVAR